MPFVTLGAQDIERLLPMSACIEVMARALADLERGELKQPLRSVFMPPDAKGGMAWMPAHRAGPRAVFGMKVLCVMPGNPAHGLDSHQGQVLLADGETGQLRAVLDASAVTAIRTAAVSALATRLSCPHERPRPGHRRHGRAGAQASGVDPARPADRARPGCRRTPGPRQHICEGSSGASAVPIEAAESVQAAVRDADIVVTATSSATPVLARVAGRRCHVNAIGASRPTHHEIDVETIADALLLPTGASHSSTRPESIAGSGEGPDRRLARPRRARRTLDRQAAGSNLGRSAHALSLARARRRGPHGGRICPRGAKESGVGVTVDF